MTVFTKDDFPETDTHKKGPFTQGWEDSEASPVRGGQVWALLQLFLIHQRNGSFDCLKSRLIVRGGTQLRAVREAPGRGWRQGAWSDRPVILKEMSLRE